MKHIGNEIKRVVEKTKIGRRQLAYLLQMSENNVSKIYQKHSIDSALLFRISQILNVPINTFFDENINETNTAIIQTGTYNINGDSVHIKTNHDKDEIYIKEIEGMKKEIEYLKQQVKDKMELLQMYKEREERRENIDKSK
jgi:transcriptional regulator with XRE-family HTH domain